MAEAKDIDAVEELEGTPLQRLTSGVSGGVILVALVLVCYISTLQFGYIWDDDAYVTQNQTLRSFGGLSRIWTEIGATPQYYPMTFTSFWLEAQATQSLNPRVSHGVNFLLHAGSALLIWQILRRLAVPGAWVAAALFAVHPIHVESVAWITERKNTLSLLLGLAATFFYLRYTGLIEKPAAPAPLPVKKTGGGAAQDEDDEQEAVQLSLPDDPRRLYALFLVFFAMALLSKTVMAVLPVILLVITWWKRGRLGKSDFLPLVAPLIMGLGLGAVTSYIEHSPDYVGATGPEWDNIQPYERLMLAGQTTLFYAAKLVFPYPLIFNYPRWTLNAGNVLQWLPLAGVLIAVGAALALRRRMGRGLVAGVICFLVCLLPVMGFVNFLPMRFAWVADHFAYMASIPLLALLVAGGALLLQRMLREESAVETVGAVVTSVVVVAFAFLAIRHSFAFENSRVLWETTLKQNPRSWIGAVNFGGILIDKGKSDFAYGLATADIEEGQRQRDINFDAAEQWLKRALKLNPQSYEAHYQLARLAVERGQYDLAVQQAYEADKLKTQLQKKSFLQPQFMVAQILAAQGKTDEAIAEYRSLQNKGYERLYARQAPATFAQIRMALAETLKRKLSGPISRAMPEVDREIVQDILEQYTVAVEIAPTFIPPKLRLAELLMQIEEHDLALQQISDALALDRDNIEAKYLGAQVAMSLEQYEVAGAQIVNLLETNPRFMIGYVKLAEVLDKLNRRQEAIDQLNLALRIRSDYLPAIELKEKLTGQPQTRPSTRASTRASPAIPAGELPAGTPPPAP